MRHFRNAVCWALGLPRREEVLELNKRVEKLEDEKAELEENFTQAEAFIALQNDRIRVLMGTMAQLWNQTQGGGIESLPYPSSTDDKEWEVN